MSYRKRLLLLLAVVTLPLTLGACNTMQGMGKDIEAAGDKIENEADKKKTY